jgi:hypothetical protein
VAFPAYVDGIESGQQPQMNESLLQVTTDSAIFPAFPAHKNRRFTLLLQAGLSLFRNPNGEVKSGVY